MLNARTIIIGAVLLLLCVGAGMVSGQPSLSESKYERAQITSIQHPEGGAAAATVNVLGGEDKGRTLAASVGVPPGSFDLAPPVYQPGDSVLLSREADLSGQPVFVVVDHYRLTFAFWLLAIILGLAVLFAGWRGVGSLLGLILSVVVLAGFVIPQILRGQNPYLTTAIGIGVISSIGIFVAHGFSRRTALALISTYFTLGIAVVLSAATVGGMHLNGVTNEQVFYLSQAKPGLSMAGLLLCGMLISLIGVLDDITVGQATSVEELYKANHKLSIRDAYGRGLKIGREHIASLINTLVLVFVGTSFLFITYLSALSPYPWIVNLNSGLVMQEIARALVGSVALILAVPIATILAAKFLKPVAPAKHHSAD